MEIGSDQGENTEKLLEYCHRNRAKLHVIDPAPGYDFEDWQEKHGDRLVFYKDLSIHALREIEGPDVVLIDGDHNWYTVFNELRLIEKMCEEHSWEFPLVMLHDVAWPYGRRDLYYDPDMIPEEHRKPYEKKGMLPSVPDLVEEGGMNRHLNNAVREHESEEGVLTAVEDFLNVSGYGLELLQLPGIHGLGILTPVRLKEQNPDFASFLSELEFSQFVRRYVRGVEQDRLETEIRKQEERRERRETQRRLAKESQELRKERQKLRKERRSLREEQRKLKEMRQELNVANRDVLQLTGWLENLDSSVSALLRSRQWKVGSAVGELYRRATFKPEMVAADKQLEETLRKFRAWRGAGGDQAEDKKDGEVR